MDIPTQSDLIDRIDLFCSRHDMAETRFGRESVNNPAFIRGLRDGKSPTLETLNKIKEFMARTDAEAATRAKLVVPLEPPRETEEIELPFRQAPVNPTGATSPISSSTSEPSAPPPANGCSRSRADISEQSAGARQSPSSSEPEDPGAAVSRVPAAEGAGAGHVAPSCSGDPVGE